MRNDIPPPYTPQPSFPFACFIGFCMEVGICRSADHCRDVPPNSFTVRWTHFISLEFIRHRSQATAFKWLSPFHLGDFQSSVLVNVVFNPVTALAFLTWIAKHYCGTHVGGEVKVVSLHDCHCVWLSLFMLLSFLTFRAAFCCCLPSAQLSPQLSFKWDCAS